MKVSLLSKAQGKKKQRVREAKADTGLGNYRDACRESWILMLLAYHETRDNYHCRNTDVIKINIFRSFCLINIQIVGN